MAQTRKDGSLVLMGDADYQPVHPDKPAPGGHQDNTPPAPGLRDAILKATGADKVIKALGGK